MPRTHPPNPPEFRHEAVRLARESGKPASQIARDLGVSYEAWRHWSKQSDLDAGRRTDGLTTTEYEELRRLRRENRVLREEREILREAAAFLARETGSMRLPPSGSQRSSRPHTTSLPCAACSESPPAATTWGARDRASASATADHHPRPGRRTSAGSGRPGVCHRPSQSPVDRGRHHIRIWSGWLYLAVVLETFSRRVVGWAMAETLERALVVDALNMALWNRRPKPGLIHHSDRGGQYTSLAFGRRCREAGILPSMGRGGNA